MKNEELTGKVAPDTSGKHCTLDEHGNFYRSETTLGNNFNENDNDRHNRLVRNNVIKESYKGERDFLLELQAEREQAIKERIEKANNRY